MAVKVSPPRPTVQCPSPPHPSLSCRGSVSLACLAQRTGKELRILSCLSSAHKHTLHLFCSLDSKLLNCFGFFFSFSLPYLPAPKAKLSGKGQAATGSSSILVHIRDTAAGRQQENSRRLLLDGDFWSSLQAARTHV